MAFASAAATPGRREGRVPGLGRGGPGRPWSLSSLGSAVAWLRPLMGVLPPCLWGCSPPPLPRPPLGSEHRCAGRGGRSKAIFPRNLAAREAPVLTGSSSVASNVAGGHSDQRFRRTAAPRRPRASLPCAPVGAQPSVPRPCSTSAREAEGGAEPPRASCVPGWFCVFSANSVSCPEHRSTQENQRTLTPSRQCFWLSWLRL